MYNNKFNFNETCITTTILVPLHCSTAITYELVSGTQIKCI